MSKLILLATLALTNAQRGATPTGHALLLGTQRTGTTWAMAELAKSPCVSTTSELFIQFKWERGARMACLRMLYGESDARDRSLRHAQIKARTAKVLAREEKKTRSTCRRSSPNYGPRPSRACTRSSRRRPTTTTPNGHVDDVEATRPRAKDVRVLERA